MRALLDLEVADHRPNVPDFDGGIMPPAVLAARETGVGAAIVGHEPVVFARLALMPGGTRVQHGPDFTEWDGSK